MTQKFGRSYRLTIDPQDGGLPITVMMPFTIEFWVQRNTLADLNRLSIDIYNLSEANRSRIFQDRFDLTRNRTLIFEAGYSTLYRIFSGRIFEASSAREGNNIVTRIECRSGQYDVATSQVFQTLQGTPANPLTLGSVFKSLIGVFPTLTLGAVGNFDQKMIRPVVLNGSTWDILKQYAPGQVYIDNNKVFVLQHAEVLAADGNITVINDSTGLLDTPRRDDAFLTITTLLEAGINMAQLINLQSSIQKGYNGQYKVVGIQHQGMISGAVSGNCRSTFSLLAPNKFGAFVPVSTQ